MFNRKLALRSVLILASVLAAVTPSMAYAAPEGQNSGDQRLRDALVDAELAPSVVERLITKSQNGVPWDSESGVRPVSSRVEMTAGYRVTTRVFPDGSFIEEGIELGSGATAEQLARMVADAAPYLESDYDGDSIVRAQSAYKPMASRGIADCVYGYSAGVRYAENCRAYYHGIMASNSFRANYQQWSSGSRAQYIAGTAKFVSLAITVSNEQVNVYNGNRIRYSFNTSLNGVGNLPGYLQLSVSKTGATVTAG